MSRQGRHGEWKFGEICTSSKACAEAVVNKATDDQHGWDHIVEIVPKENACIPADLKTHVIQCFVQIKTTNSINPKTSLKLSNAIKAAKSSLPSFVFLLKYVEGASNPIIYGRHIWEKEIAHWLKRARDTEISGRSDLHNLTVSMSFSESDRLDINPIDWILEKLRPFGDTYSSKKSEMVGSVGYEKHGHEGKITIGPIDSIGDIIDAELGLTKDLPVKNFQLYDHRFGIKSNSPIHEHSEGRISFSQEGRPVTLQLELDEGQKVFAIPAMIKTPRVVDVNHDEFKYRLTAGHIEFVASLADLNLRLNLQFDPKKPFSLIEQIGFLCLRNWSNQGVLEFRVLSDVGQLSSGVFNDATGNEPWMLDVENVGHHLIDVLGVERCQKIRLSLTELYDIGCSMHLVCSVFSGGVFRFEAEFGEEIEPFEKLIGYYYGQIGDWCFGVIYEAASGGRSSDGSRQSFYFKNPRVIQKLAFKQSLAQAKRQIEANFKSYKNAQSMPVASFHKGNLVAWSKALTSNDIISLSVD